MKASLKCIAAVITPICCLIYLGFYDWNNTKAVKAELSAKNTEIVALKADLTASQTRQRTLQATLNACAAKRPVFRPHRPASTSTPTILGWPVHK